MMFATAAMAQCITAVFGYTSNPDSLRNLLDGSFHCQGTWMKSTFRNLIEKQSRGFLLSGFLPHSHFMPLQLRRPLPLIQLYINLELTDILKKAKQQTMDFYKKLLGLAEQTVQSKNDFLEFND